MTIEQTDQRLFKGTTAEILAFVPPSFDGWTYAESTDDNSAYRWNSTTARWGSLASVGNEDVIIYVNTVTGNDTNPGTAAAPVKTFAGISALLPTTHRGLCRAYIQDTVASLLDMDLPGSNLVNAAWFPPHPMGATAEPFTLIGKFLDSGLGTRTSTTISVLANSAGIVVTDSSLAIGLNAYQGFRFRVISGPETGKYAAIAANTVGGAFTLLLPPWALPLFVAGDKFVIEQPATTLYNPTGALFQQGPEAFGLYGVKAYWDNECSNGARVAMESCWGGPRFGRGNVTYVLGNLRAGYNVLGIGSKVGNFDTTGLDTNGACTMDSTPNQSINCTVVGSFVSVGVGTGWSIASGCYVLLIASWGGVMFVGARAVLHLSGYVRHRSQGISAASMSYVSINGCDMAGTTGLVAAARSYCQAFGLTGSITGTAVRVSSGSRVSMDAASTITGTVSDFNVGLLGNKSQADLGAAPNLTLSDYTIAGSTGCSLTRGAA